MTQSRVFMLLRPRSMDAEEVACILGAMETLDPFPPTDPLGEALHFLRMNGAFYCRSELSAPWGLTLPPMPGYIWFHVVTSGRLWLETGRRRGQAAGAGRPRARPARRRPRACAATRALPAPGILDLERELVSDRYEILRHGGGGAPTGLICGAVRFDHPAARNLVEILPASIHLEASDAAQLDWMQSTLRLMAAEAERAAPRRRGRDHSPGRHPRDPGDPLLDRERPGRPDRLARRVAGPPDRSRDLAHPSRPGARLDGRLARRRSWRCHARHSRPASPNWSASPRCSTSPAGGCSSRSARWRTSDVTVGELADRLGYRSEAAFSRAFKRIIGVSPGSVTQPLRSPANLWRYSGQPPSAPTPSRMPSQPSPWRSRLRCSSSTRVRSGVSAMKRTSTSLVLLEVGLDLPRAG